jgi:hypothetical protein
MLKNCCIICENDPSAHSFQTIYSVNPNIHLFYSCPASASQYYDSSGVIHHFTNTINAIEKPWVYILDCSGFTFQHASQIYTSIQIAKKVLEKSDILKKIYIVNYTWSMKIIINAIWFLLPESIIQKITYSENTVINLQHNYLIDII